MKLADLISHLVQLEDEGHGLKEVWARGEKHSEEVLILVEHVKIDKDGEVELS